MGIVTPICSTRGVGKCSGTDSPPKSHPVTAPPPKKNPNAAEVYGFIGLMTNSVVKLQTVLDATVWEWVLASSA